MAWAFAVGRVVLPYRQLVLFKKNASSKNTYHMQVDEQTFEAQGQLAFEYAHGQWVDSRGMSVMYSNAQLLQVDTYLDMFAKNTGGASAQVQPHTSMPPLLVLLWQVLQNLTFIPHPRNAYWPSWAATT